MIGKVTLMWPAHMQIGSGFVDSIGNKVTRDAAGVCTVDPTVVRVNEFIAAGFRHQTPAEASATTATAAASATT